MEKISLKKSRIGACYFSVEFCTWIVWNSRFSIEHHLFSIEHHFYRTHSYSMLALFRSYIFTINQGRPLKLSMKAKKCLNSVTTKESDMAGACLYPNLWKHIGKTYRNVSIQRRERTQIWSQWVHESENFWKIYRVVVNTPDINMRYIITAESSSVNLKYLILSTFFL